MTMSSDESMRKEACLTTEAVQTQYTDAGMRIIGKLRLLSQSSTGCVTVQAELIGHHFIYDAASTEGRIEGIVHGRFHIGTLAEMVWGGEVTLSADATIPLPSHSTAHTTTWELQLGVYQDEQCISNTVSVWGGAKPRPNAWEGFLLGEAIEHTTLAPAVDLYHITGQIKDGPVELWLMVTDVLHPQVRVESLQADQPFPDSTARWPRSVVSHMLETAGGIAAINASFFEIKTTMNPRGMRIQNGKLLKSGNPGWAASVGFTTGSTPYFGYWQWYGVVRRLGRRIATFSTTGTGADELGLFAWPWVRSPGCDAADKNKQVVELVLTEVEEYAHPGIAELPEVLPGMVRAMRARVGAIRKQQEAIAIEQGMYVLTGFGEAADCLLRTYSLGDEVEILYAVSGETFWPGLADMWQLRSVVCGNMMLLKHGNYGDERVFRLTERHPHTAVAATWDQHTLYWLTVDGRSERSIGMNYKELADFFLYIGAFNAINCDGGGSTTLAIRNPQTQLVRVVNSPSDGAQRPVPDGLVIHGGAREHRHEYSKPCRPRLLFRDI